MKSIHILLTKLVAIVLCLLWAGASTAPVHASQLSCTKDGDYLRGLVQQDLNAGDRLLCDKYHWIKTHIFHGVEFKKHSEPLNEP